MVLNRDQFAYRGLHQAPDEESGAPMHDVEGVMPDFYKHPEYYHSRDVGDLDSERAIKSVRGNPDASVRVFRAVPPGVSAINHGDWVTPSHEYAQRHGYDPEDESKDWPVISAHVKAKHLFTSGDSMAEFGYTGPGVPSE